LGEFTIALTYPIKLGEDLVCTLKINITVQRETRALALSKGIQPDELENMVNQEMMAIHTLISGALGLEELV
jgi:hypothetical protein